MRSYPVVCTAIPKKRLPWALALGRAVAAQHEGERLMVLVVDEPIADRPDREAVIFLHPNDLPIAPKTIHELALCLDADDVAACLAPALLQEMLRRQGDRSVVFLDADTVVLNPLDELGDLARASGIVLLPRVLTPLPRDGKEPDELDLTELGVYDPGCVAVAHGAESFLSWWHDALYELASTEGARPSLAQSVLDFAPGIFSVRVLSDPSYAIAYWNAHERLVSKTLPLALRVGNLPVRTVHLKGFDPATPSLMSSFASLRPRGLLSEHRGLAQLCSTLCTEIGGALGDGVAESQGFKTLADGAEVDDRIRRLVRRALRREGNEVEEIPDPFLKESVVDFYDWLASPDPVDPMVRLVPRYLREIVADRFDLQWRFQRIGTVNAPLFREWVENHGFDEEDLPAQLRQAIKRTRWWHAPCGIVSAKPNKLRNGVTFAGYLNSSMGVGEAGRLVLDALVRLGIEVSPVATGRASFSKPDEFGDDVLVADRSTNVVWVNADQLSGFASIVGPEFFDGRYSVGGWVWETERLPDEMAKNSELVDEIWVPSEFVRRAVEPVVQCPVFVFPYPVVVPERSSFNRASFGIPQGFVYLFAFDFLSSSKRKNPLGLVDAYCRAFSPADGAVLVLKSVNGYRRPAELEELRLAASSRPDVVVIDRRMDAAARGALLGACNCFASLHRSEGFGLAIAEAMALAKPVVGTGYSGNLEFMDEDCSYLVPARRVAVGPGAPPYPAEDSWGEPDLDVASEMLRRVFDNQQEAAMMGERGRDRIFDLFRADRSASFLSRRLEEIDRMRRTGYVSPVADAVRRRT